MAILATGQPPPGVVQPPSNPSNTSPPLNLSQTNPQTLNPSYKSILHPNVETTGSISIPAPTFDLHHGEPSFVWEDKVVEVMMRHEELHFAVIGKFSYGMPEFHELRKQIPLQCEIKGQCLIGFLETRHVVIRLSCLEDYVHLLSRPAFSLKVGANLYPMRTMKYDVWFDPREETSIAVAWISFPGLPPAFFVKDAVFALASAVGKPLQLDAATKSKTRPSCAKVKVEVDLIATKPQRLRIGIKNSSNGEIRYKWIRIRYDFLPKYCKECRLQGHIEEECFSLHPELVSVEKVKAKEDHFSKNETVKAAPFKVLQSGKIVGNVLKEGEDAAPVLTQGRQGKNSNKHLHPNRNPMAWTIVEKKTKKVTIDAACVNQGEPVATTNAFAMLDVNGNRHELGKSAQPELDATVTQHSSKGVNDSTKGGDFLSPNSMQIGTRTWVQEVFKHHPKDVAVGVSIKSGSGKSRAVLNEMLGEVGNVKIPSQKSCLSKKMSDGLLVGDTRGEVGICSDSRVSSCGVRQICSPTLIKNGSMETIKAGRSRGEQLGSSCIEVARIHDAAFNQNVTDIKAAVLESTPSRLDLVPTSANPIGHIEAGGVLNSGDSRASPACEIHRTACVELNKWHAHGVELRKAHGVVHADGESRGNALVEQRGHTSRGNSQQTDLEPQMHVDVVERCNIVDKIPLAPLVDVELREVSTFRHSRRSMEQHSILNPSTMGNSARGTNLMQDESYEHAAVLHDSCEHAEATLPKDSPLDSSEHGNNSLDALKDAHTFDAAALDIHVKPSHRGAHKTKASQMVQKTALKLGESSGMRTDEHSKIPSQNSSGTQIHGKELMLHQLSPKLSGNKLKEPVGFQVFNKDGKASLTTAVGLPPLNNDDLIPLPKLKLMTAQVNAACLMSGINAPLNTSVRRAPLAAVDYLSALPVIENTSQQEVPSNSMEMKITSDAAVDGNGQELPDPEDDEELLDYGEDDETDAASTENYEEDPADEYIGLRGLLSTDSSVKGDEFDNAQEAASPKNAVIEKQQGTPEKAQVGAEMPLDVGNASPGLSEGRLSEKELLRAAFYSSRSNNSQLVAKNFEPKPHLAHLVDKLPAQEVNIGEDDELDTESTAQNYVNAAANADLSPEKVAEHKKKLKKYRGRRDKSVPPTVGGRKSARISLSKTSGRQ